MKHVAMGLILAGVGGWVMAQDPGARAPQKALEPSIVKAADVKWVDAKGLPAGAKVCFLHGDPAKEASTCLMKFPAGITIPAHWHSSDEIVTVNSGSVTFGFSEKADESKGTVVEAGGFIVIPAKTPHWAIAKTDTQITKHSAGIGDFNPCK